MAIEAALVFSLCAVLLAGMVEVGQALRRWYQLSTLTDHVGQMIARADAPSTAFIQTVLHNEQTLPVLVQGGAVLQLGIVTVQPAPAGASGGQAMTRYGPDSAGGCTPHDPAAGLSALSGVAGSFVVVQGCIPAQPSRILGGGLLPTLYSSAVFALKAPLTLR